MAKRQTTVTTGRGLSADEAFTGLVDYGLFGEKPPPCFTSEGLSSHVPKGFLSLTRETDKKKLDKLFDKGKGRHDFIRYESLRDVNVPRQMGVPHPESYIVQCLVLKKHWEEIKEYCAKPEIPVSRVFVRKTSSKRVFRMNYKGKDRWENEERDIRNKMGAHYVVQADISNFFPSIYTHSIPWALHGHSRAKKEQRSLLLSGNLLDKATRNARDGQTNGLLIGPHTSNVISEIILTSIDRLMVQKKYKQLSHHIDDYTYYAKTYDQAEDFIRDLGLQLREFQLGLNERKTKILPLPLPIDADWRRELNDFRRRELNDFRWPAEGEAIRFATVSSLLDLALELAHKAETSAVLNYAIQMVPSRLNDRAKRLFVQQAVNLALLYPYLAQILDKHVFDKHRYDGVEKVVLKFAERLLEIGIQRIYPDAIAYALYYSLKYDLQFKMPEDKLHKNIIEIDDCLSQVLLLEYAKRHKIKSIRKAIRNRARRLRGMETREQDRFWLLIYQLWQARTLSKEGQLFLAELKKKRFKFVSF